MINLQNDLSNKRMKIIYKNKTVRIFSLGLMLASIVSIGLFVQSCSQDDDYLAIEDSSINAKYLDFDVESSTKISSEEIKILTDAIERASNYLVFDGEKYVCKLESAREINISDRLFNYIYPIMQNIQTTNIPRLKYDVETSGGGGSNVVDVDFNHQETIQAYGNISTSSTWYGYVTSCVVGVINTAAGIIYSGLQALNNQIESNKYQDYISSGSTKGSTFTIVTTMLPNGMGCTNSIFISYHK